MKKVAIGLLLVTLLLGSLFFMLTNPAEAYWFWRDVTGVDAVRVCRDGIYMGVAIEGEHGDVLVRAHLQPDDEVVFERTYVAEEDLPHYDPMLRGGASYGYFLERWDRPLMPGDEVALDGQNPADPVPVKDCYVNIPEPPSSFTFQGTLSDGEEPANGAYDFRIPRLGRAHGRAPRGAGRDNRRRGSRRRRLYRPIGLWRRGHQHGARALDGYGRTPRREHRQVYHAWPAAGDHGRTLRPDPDGRRRHLRLPRWTCTDRR